MSLILKLSALALAAAVMSVLLRELHAAFVLPFEIAAVVFLLLVLLSSMHTRFASFFSLLESVGLPMPLFETLLKGAAVCLVSEFCAALCREAGNAAVSGVVAFAGRLLTLMLCLPLCEAVIQTAVSFVQ